MTMMVVDEDHYVFTVVYGAGSHAISKDKLGTRYALAAIRSWWTQTIEGRGVTPQDASRSSNRGPGKFEVPNWDQASRKKVADALVVSAIRFPDWRRAYRRMKSIDPTPDRDRDGWALNPDKDAIYLNLTPK